ncbi:O-antigen polymerase [Plantactinospora sp. GCM10030261]|uniref:O-antigen polymerase n=1 Tax=Plantactinospora sp. GCM10030261 TaxID=3273420 RepID=UPI00362235D7
MLSAGDVPLALPVAAAVTLTRATGPLALWIWGQPNDTGAFHFRTLIGMTNDGQGWGYSIPAEGALNFGLPGVLLLPFVYGLALAWLYARFSAAPTRALELIYSIAAASVPFAFRSDVHGAVKLGPASWISVARGGVQAAIRQGGGSSVYRCCIRTNRQRRRASSGPAAARQRSRRQALALYPAIGLVFAFGIAAWEKRTAASTRTLDHLGVVLWKPPAALPRTPPQGG